MSTYLSPETLRELRAERGLTQAALAEKIGVTDKAVSKWETGRGLPDITLIDDLASAVGCSVAELLCGEVRRNANRAANMSRCIFYVCPICGNVVVATGEGSFSCCGSTMLPQEAETPEPGSAHDFSIERVEHEWYVTAGNHPMTKQHFVSFIAYVTSDGVNLKKLYPEQLDWPRFHMTGSGWIYVYCNRHGLYRKRTPRVR